MKKGNFDLKKALSAREQQVQKAVEITFGELCRAYLAAHYSGADMQLRKWIDLLGDQSAWTVTTNQIADALHAMVDAGYALATVNRNASQIGSVYKWSKDIRRITPAGFVSPTKSLPRFAEELRRIEISDDEVRRLVDASAAVRDRRFAVLVRLLVDTGARRGEILERRRCDVDVAARTVTCNSTKTGQPRILKFSAETAALFTRVFGKAAPDDMLFESTRAVGAPKTFKKSWKAIVKAIGRPDIRMHDLRHHRAKKLLLSGAGVSVAAQALGHSSLILHRRYGHLDNAGIHQAVEKSW